MMRIERGAKRTSDPDIFISHSSLDKAEAVRLAEALNSCSVDVWLDDWELEAGQSLTEEIARAMDRSRFIAILITANYNKTVWTKTEYKKALAREQSEGRTVMLPLIVGQAVIPSFIEDKLYVDLRQEFWSGILRIVGMIHGLSPFRISQAIREKKAESAKDAWESLQSIGFEPYIVLGDDDFDEVLKYGGDLKGPDYATFDPRAILHNSTSTPHIKRLIGGLA